MKKYIFFTFLLIMVSAYYSEAQITLILALNSRPQPYLSDWSNQVNGQMIISYLQSANIDPQVKIKSSLLNENGDAVGSSNLASSAIVTLAEGVNTFTMADALQLSNLTLTGNAQNVLRQTGRLAAGQYQLKVELYNASGEILRAQQTRSFFMTSYLLPVLIQPANDAELDAHIAQAVIVFRWTSLVPLSQERPSYLVQVFEVLPGQSPMQAFRSNMPILNEASTTGLNQYIWRPNLSMLDSLANKQFIWTVQTLDFKGEPFASNDANVQGRSEPAVFNIVNKTAKPKS